jgi:coronin-1B/1C/6
MSYSLDQAEANYNRDGNIRYFEYVNDKFEFLSEFKSADPQRGIAFVPKRGVNVRLIWNNRSRGVTNAAQVHENEIMRAYKTVNDTWIEPVSFIVPRRAEIFQEDIYPPAVGLKPATTSSEWFSGKDGMPAKISMESIYDGASEPKEVPSDYKPKTSTPITKPPPTKAAYEPTKPAPAAAPEPEPVRRGTPPKMEDNKASISAMASKFADKDEASEDDEESSFEEIQKPIERPSVTTSRQELKTRGPEISKAVPAKEPEKPVSPIKAAPAPSAQPGLTRSDSSKLWSKVGPSSDSSAPTSPPPTASTTNGPTPSGAAEGLRGQLLEMKDMHNRTLSLLESQQRMLGKQMDQIMFLSAEVETFKTRLQEQKSSRDKDERIRRLELELEELRSQDGS